MPIMPVIDSIPAWLSASPSAAPNTAAADESAPFKLPQGGAVEACSEAETVGAPAFGGPALRAGSFPPVSAFPDLDPLADTLLAKIAAGTECLAAIAAFHHIPYPRFTLWLLQPSTQERLAALSTAIASAARLTATAALPDIVRGLKSTVDQLQSQTLMTIAPPGANHLLAESIILRRHRALISAASLIYRISRFTCPAPPDPRTDVPPRSALGSRCSSREREHIAATRRGLARLPRLDLPSIDFTDLDPRPARNTAAASELLPRQREVSPKATEGAPVFPSASSTSSPSSASRIPSVFSVSSVVQLQVPASELASPSDEQSMSADEAIQAIIEDFDLTDEEAEELRKDPPSWIRENLLEQNGFVEVKPRTKRRSRASADDG